MGEEEALGWGGQEVTYRPGQKWHCGHWPCEFVVSHSHPHLIQGPDTKTPEGLEEGSPSVSPLSVRRHHLCPPRHLPGGCLHSVWRCLREVGQAGSAQGLSELRAAETLGSIRPRVVSSLWGTGGLSLMPHGLSAEAVAMESTDSSRVYPLGKMKLSVR